NFLAAKAEAKAAMLLMDMDGKLAKHALKSAEQDWGFATGGIQNDDLDAELAGAALNASLTLFEATGNDKYKNASIAYGDYILQSQQQENLVDNVPLKGFFYRTKEKEEILH